MKILNTEKEDFHLHSSTFSDGLSSIDEIASFAGTIGMKKLIITDHSQAALDWAGYGPKKNRSLIRRWKNVFNEVDVSFGVEADLLNEKGDICSQIGGVEGDFIVLSYHKDIYKGDFTRVAEGFVQALDRHRARINIIGHICLNLTAPESEKVILAANERGIPLELNSSYFLRDTAKWEIFLEKAELVYINSDAHTLWELKNSRQAARDILKQKGISL